MNSRGTFWMVDYYDRFIRDGRHLARAIAYVERNPVKAGLCREAQDWPFSSARLRKRGGMDILSAHSPVGAC